MRTIKIQYERLWSAAAQTQTGLWINCGITCYWGRVSVLTGAPVRYDWGGNSCLIGAVRRELRKCLPHDGL